MIKKIYSILFVLLMVFFIGCASIVSNSNYPVTVNSNPADALVTVKNKSGVDVYRGPTPTTVTLSAKNGYFSSANYSFNFEKEGYLPSSVPLSANMDSWYIGNILFGGLIGFLIVDPATGAMWELDETVYGNLSPNPEFQAAINVEAVEEIEKSESIPEQLKQVKELKDSGVLTDEEYEVKRKALVDKL